MRFGTIVASKGWGEGEDLEFAAVKEKAEELGDAPGSNPYYEETADKDGKYMSYGFDNKEDSSENNRDIKETNDKVEGAVQTGDTANAVPWIVCLGAAAGAGVVVLKSRKKRS